MRRILHTLPQFWKQHVTIKKTIIKNFAAQMLTLLSLNKIVYHFVTTWNMYRETLKKFLREKPNKKL